MPSETSASARLELHHLPFLEGHLPVHALGELQVVGGDDGGEAGGAYQLGECVEHAVGGAQIEVSGWLVGKQNARRVGDGARDRDALLLAAGELRRPMGETLLKAQVRQQLGGARVRLALANPRIICGSITFSSAESSGSR